MQASAGYGRRMVMAEPAARPMPVRMKRAPYHRAGDDLDEARADQPKLGSTRALVVRLRPDLKVTGVSRAAVEPRLTTLVSSLGSKLRSISSGQTGTLALRLTVDKSGRVTHVAFVSGTLNTPALTAELERLLKTWRLGALPAETTLSFTLLFS
jgi:hypothetical protein